MAKARTSFICQQCGYQTSYQMGKCPSCGSWGSFSETIVKESTGTNPKGKASTRTALEPVKLSDVQKKDFERVDTGISEFNRVLGGGMVPGSVILLAGEPGIGKSTLLLQTAGSLGALYVAGEESPHQIKLRADRLARAQKNGHTFANVEVLSSTNVDEIVETIKEKKPNLVIVDSIQTLTTDDLSGTAGSVGQVRETVDRIFRYVKSEGISTILVGHVTKEGTIAGPKVVEHMVDAVMYMEGDQYRAHRIMRSSKNRFGRVDEIGVFEMTEEGLKEITNPSELFLENRLNEAGSVVVPVLEGDRPILTEVQALTSKTFFGLPRRTAGGIDVNRLNLLAAVLSRRAGIKVDDQDIFANVAGGMKVNEPGIDLGVAVAIASSVLNKPVDQKTIVIGEVGLLGEIRMVSFLPKRLEEAKKLGFKTFITPDNSKTLKDALKKALKIG